MHKHRILLVDDEATLTHLLKLNLEGTGQYEVRTENEGLRALAAAREFRPELILLDVVMPNVGGGEVASQIHADPRLEDVPIVFMTAIVSQEEADKHGGMFGGHPFLAKPVSVETLVACIEHNLPHHDEE